MKPLHRTPSAVAAIAVAAALAALAQAPSAMAEDKKPATAKPALTVSTVRPQKTSLPIRLTANGNVAAWQEAIISSESNGLRLSDVKVNVGDAVTKGEVLAVFAPETPQAEVAQAKAALMEAEAAAAEAKANADRARSIEDTGALSAQQISQYTTAEATAKARAASAKAMLASAELRLRYTRVVAPDAGVISARSATVGAVAGPGTELFRMIRQGRLEWRAEVTAADLRNVKLGGSAVVKAANGSELTGKVRMVAPTIDPQTRSALVYVDLPPNSGKQAPFKAGMFASGQFELGASDALTVPQQAITVRDGFSYVFRLNQDQRVSQVKVQPGRRIGERIEVLSGLAPDAQIVAAGAGFLNDGDLVRNTGAPAQASTPIKPAR
ncbi:MULTISPECIES: efflux RND transporter periplasmic adaptor subunit [unclassified Duganella]|uniref:efflux RND transporter periplasmic adaptor subunit n=1 Tax=unclassified Duganella TaxID=2636909 RepID=UPI0006FCED49|nr:MULTISPECIES: efflux RND transporter periplasmic adaptor subunit [unclassified Duganella]KQV53999.1 RND transporter [Duganella sp. Root336D2]KRB98211.1 RND transporter [Duganella sp. Root198D2]